MATKSAVQKYRATISSEKKEIARIKARDRMRARRAAKKAAIESYDSTSPTQSKTLDVREKTIDRIRRQMNEKDGLSFLRD